MYRSLLVPLDRSLFAEQALPLALNIARRAGARLDLVAVHALRASISGAFGLCWHGLLAHEKSLPYAGHKSFLQAPD